MRAYTPSSAFEFMEGEIRKRLAHWSLSSGGVSALGPGTEPRVCNVIAKTLVWAISTTFHTQQCYLCLSHTPAMICSHQARKNTLTVHSGSTMCLFDGSIEIPSLFRAE